MANSFIQRNYLIYISGLFYFSLKHPPPHFEHLFNVAPLSKYAYFTPPPYLQIGQIYSGGSTFEPKKG